MVFFYLKINEKLLRIVFKVVEKNTTKTIFKKILLKLRNQNRTNKKLHIIT